MPELPRISGAQSIKENLEDYEDLKDLREAKAAEADAPTTRLSDIRTELLAD